MWHHMHGRHSLLAYLHALSVSSSKRLIQPRWARRVRWVSHTERWNGCSGLIIHSTPPTIFLLTRSVFRVGRGKALVYMFAVFELFLVSLQWFPHAERDRESVGLGEVRDGAYLVVVECRRTTGDVTSSPSLLPPERKREEDYGTSFLSLICIISSCIVIWQVYEEKERNVIRNSCIISEIQRKNAGILAVVLMWL